MGVLSSTPSPVPFTSMCGFHDCNKLTNRTWECNRDFASDWVVWLIVVCLCYQWDKLQEILGRVWEAQVVPDSPLQGVSSPNALRPRQRLGGVGMIYTASNILSFHRFPL